jgi:hypothetical protein
MRVIPPTNLRDYLKANGWNPIEKAYSDRLYVLENPEYPKRQLVFPMDTQAIDYVEATEGVLSKLASIVGERADAICRKVLGTPNDALRVVIDGSQSKLPLAFASNLLVATQRILKAAACTVLKPRLHHPRLTLTDAVQLVEHSSFEHTEPGSFILQVSCPVLALDVQGELEFGEECFSQSPFVRRALLTLFYATASIVEAIERDKLEDLLDGLKVSKSPLVSSNLCEALQMLQDDSLQNSVEMKMQWSPTIPVKSKSPWSIRIQKDYFSRIEQLRRELRSGENEHEDVFVGTVERLDGEMSDSGTRSGEVILSLLMSDGEMVRARVSLSSEDYALADRAHMRDGCYVRVRGKLRHGRQPRQLTNVTLFELLDPDVSDH